MWHSSNDSNECQKIQMTSIVSICYSENEQRFVFQRVYGVLNKYVEMLRMKMSPYINN